jgi:predicted nucleic acid-binding Zn ribbon protein
VRRRAPRTLAHALETITAKVAPAGLLSEVQAAWREAVGETIAEVAQPVSERAGTVVVSCESAVWAQELELLAPTLVEAINRRLGEQRVRSLSCRVSRSSRG